MAGRDPAAGQLFVHPCKGKDSAQFLHKLLHRLEGGVLTSIVCLPACLPALLDGWPPI